jgi:hypothetical protein
MDLANLDTAKFGSRGSWMDVLHPSGDGTALVDEQSKETVALHLRGADAPETTTAQRERVQRRLDRRRQRQTADDIDDDLLETAVAATIGWRDDFFEGKYALSEVPLDSRAGSHVPVESSELPGGAVDELVAFARREFENWQRTPDGGNVGGHQRQAAKSTFFQLADKAALPAQQSLEGSDRPPELQYLWNDYLRLHCSRPSGFDLGAITQAEIQSYQGNFKVQFASWEIDAILALDNALRQVTRNARPS